MPWKETDVMSEKERFAVLAQTGRYRLEELCRDFGLSRKTGRKYLARYRREGREGMTDRSRRPKSSPNATVGAVEVLVVKERLKHPTWGPKKLTPTSGADAPKSKFLSV